MTTTEVPVDTGIVSEAGIVTGIGGVDPETAPIAASTPGATMAATGPPTEAVGRVVDALNIVIPPAVMEDTVELAQVHMGLRVHLNTIAPRTDPLIRVERILIGS